MTESKEALLKRIDAALDENEAVYSQRIERAVELVKKLNALHQKEAEIVAEIDALFSAPEPVKKDANPRKMTVEKDANTDVERLFDRSIWVLLKHNGINTIGDILNVPVADWNKKSYLGEKILYEIESKMNKSGYDDFYIPRYRESYPDGSFEQLDLSSRVLKLLNRAGIRTIDDLLNVPDFLWHRIEGLGKAAAKEIESKMNKNGYSDFRIKLNPIRPYPF